MHNIIIHSNKPMLFKQVRCVPIFLVVLVSTILTFFQLRVAFPSLGSEDTGEGASAWHGYNVFSKDHHIIEEITPTSMPTSISMPCKLSNDDDLPKPVILMARGRSGSSVTWDTVSELMGQRNIAWELTGGNRNSSLAFFDSLAARDLDISTSTNHHHGYDWAVNHLCLLQQHHQDLSNSTIVGFQWKPFTSSFDHEYAVEGLRYIAAQQNPPIKVIYLTRNCIDKKISNLRHKEARMRGVGHVNVNVNANDKGNVTSIGIDSSNSSTAMPTTKITAHCEVDDAECIQEHLQFEENSNITFPLGPALFNWLYSNSESDKNIRKRLNTLGVQYIHVTYEKLFPATDDNENNNNDADEWIRLLTFLDKDNEKENDDGPSPKFKNITMDTVRSAFSMAPTHKKSQKEMIANYDALKKSLNGTEWQKLLLD